MATNSQRLAEFRNKKKEEENKNSSSSSGSTKNSDRLGKIRLENSIGLDTFESDLKSMDTTISGIYNGWQTPETMANTRASVESMQKRINAYQAYQKKYGGTDLSELANGYQQVLNDWDVMTSAYGHYKNANAFNAAKKKTEMDKLFKGLTYDEVQEKKKGYKEGSDEYKYLSEYTGYTDLNDFDKAIEEAKKNGGKKTEYTKAEIGRALKSGIKLEEPNNTYLDKLEIAKNKHSLNNGFDYYKHYMNEEDFAETSKYKTTKTDNIFAPYKDETYEYINNVDGARDLINGKYKDGNGATEFEQKGYDRLTSDEIAVYNSLYATDKKLANQFLKDMEVTLTKRVYDESTQKWEEMADGGAVQGALLSLATPITSLAGGIGSGIGLITGNTNPYSPFKVPANFTADTRKYVGENIEEATGGMELFGQNIPSFLYQTGMSIADSTLNAMSLGVGGAAIMGMNAYQQKEKELTEAGENKETIVATSLASGIAEFAFEKIGIEELFKIKNADGIANFIKSTLKQAGVEGLEEIGTELANVLSDSVLRGENSELYQMYADLKARGFSDKEANTEIAKQIGSQVGWAGIGGALSGGAMGGTFSGNQLAQNASTGKQVSANNRTGEMLELSSLTPKESETFKLYTEYANKGVNADNIKNAQLGNLYSTMEAETRSTLHSKKSSIDEKLTAAKNLSKLNVISTEKVTKTKSGEEVTIEGIKTEDGKQTYVTNKGEFAAKDLTLSGEDANAIAYAESFQNDAKASAFLSQYDGKTDIDQFAHSFELAYAYGEGMMDASVVLENKGVLTERQASEIWKLGMQNRNNQEAIDLQNRIDEINHRFTSNTFNKGVIDDSIIDYDNKDNSKVKWNTLTRKQRNAITFVKAFAEGTGVNLKFVKSDVVDGKRVGKNGSYNHDTNTIEIDVYAGIVDATALNDSIISTVSHEVTHWMKNKSPVMYKNMQDLVLETVSQGRRMSVNDLIAESRNKLDEDHSERKHTDDDAIDEIVARGCEDMLSNSKYARDILGKMSAEEQTTFVGRLKATIENLTDWVNELLDQYKSGATEAKILREYKDKLEELSEMWDKALAESVKANQSMQGINETMAKVGIVVDEESKSAAPQYSERTWTESEYVINREVAIKNLSKALGVSENKAKKYIDSINSVAKLIADDRARLDYDPNLDSNASVMKPNSDYKWSIDMSTLCAKRLLFTGTFDAIQKALPNTALDSDDIVKLRKMMMDRGYQVACGICYVESTRREIGTITNEFIEKYKESQKTGKPITRTNSEGKVVELKKTQDQMKTTSDKSTDKFYAEDGYTPTLADLNTTDIDLVKRDHPLVYEAYLNFMNARGQAKPKLLETRAEYNGEIAKRFARNKKGELNKSTETMNDSGGLRLQSFSDFEIAHLIDMMQVVIDMSNVGLMSQAYTKVPEFAEVFGDTGVKINLSLIAKGDGLDADGNLIFDDVEGIDHKRAFALREKFSKNVGTILVGKNDAHIIKAMADSRIDYIIPFHKSSWKESLYDALGLTGYADYTDTQHEKPLQKGRKIKDFLPSKYWDFTKSGDENAQIYLAKCKEDGRIPKFPQFQGYSGYWKLLIDFKMYDNNGVGSPQTAVQPNFDMEAANRILNDYEGGHRTFPVAKDVVDKFVAEYKNDHPQEQYSDRDYAPTFYSHMGKVVDGIKQDKIGSNSVVNYLKGKGVKDEEIKWSGIEIFLEGKKSVTKAELQEFVAGSMLQIEEETLSDTTPEGYDELKELWRYHFYESMSDYEFKESIQNSDAETLKNYVNEEYENEYIDEFDMKQLNSLIDKVYEGGTDFTAETKWKQYKLDGGSNYRELLFKMPYSTYKNSAMSAHWKQEGIIAHARIQDITTKDGKKMLFIEEIQSDWHNAGQKNGYLGKNVETIPMYNKRLEEYVKKAVDDEFGQGVYEMVFDMPFSPMTVAETSEVEEFGKIMEEKFKSENPKPNPNTKNLAEDAPFRNNYHEYVLKRLIRMASEEGYDAIGWTPADIQAERWSDEYMEGYRIEYDQDIPKFLRKYGKKWGATVGQATTTEGYDVWSMYITDAMKQSVLYEGQVMYSDRDNVSVYDAMGETDRLIAKNQRLKEDIAKLKGAISTDEVSLRRFRSLADYIKKLAGSNYNRETLGDELKEVYEFIQNEEDLHWNDVYAKTYDIARSMMANNLNVPINYFREVMAQIRRDKVTLSEAQRSEAEKLFGNYGNFHKAMFGRVNIVNEGVALEEMWERWSKIYPAVFKADVKGTDQIKSLVDITDALKATSSLMGEYEREEAIRHLATEIYNQFWNIASDSSEEVKKAKADHRKMMGELRKDYEQRQKEKSLHPVGETALKYERLLKKVSERDKAEIKKAKELGKQRVKDVRERAEKKAKIQKITKNTKLLREWLTKNTKDKHISDELKGPVRDLLVAIDFATRNSGIDISDTREALELIGQGIDKAKRSIDLRANLTTLQLAAAKDETLSRAGLDFSDEIEKLTKSLGNMNIKENALFVLNDMSLEDLATLDKIVTSLKTVVTRANQYYTLRRKQSVTASAHELFELFDSLGDVTEGNLDGIANYFNYDNITPIHFFDRLGEVGQDLFHSFIKAQDKLAFHTKLVKEFSEKTWSSKDVKKWDEDLIEFEVVDVKKTRDISKPVMKKVYTTTSRLMTLYLHDKREQSQGHLYKGGGGRFTTFEHKGKKYGEDVNGVVLTPSLVHQMLTKLDPKAKMVADAMSKFLNTTCKDWGNEITSDLYGVELFLEPKYVPIEVIEESVSREMEKPQRSITALLNKGFTKETKPNAKNQIVLDSIFNVFAKHTSEMMAYNAFAREVYDAVRLFEYKENRQIFVYDAEEGQTISDNIQIAMKGALGKGAVKYFRNLLEDINGTQQVGRGDNMLSKSFSNFKLASVAWNMNVALLQPLALTRAMVMIKPKHLVKGIFRIRDGVKKAMDHSGTALWKSYGFYDTDISRGLVEQIKNNKTFGDNLKEASMKAPEVMDQITWGVLWKACEYQVAEQHKTLKRGSKDFYDQVVELFEETVYRTQVVDSVLTRSQIMRSKSGLLKGLTSFMAEPTVTYNMVYGIFSQWNQYSRSGHSKGQCLKKYGKKLAGAIGTYCIASVTEAAVRTLTTAMRSAGGDDDEEYEEVFLVQLADSLNPLAKIPIGKEITSVLQGYGVSSIPGLNAIDAFGDAYKAISKMVVDGDEVSYKKVHKILKAVSYGTGQGVSNAYRDVVAIWNSTIGQMYPSLIIDTDE